MYYERLAPALAQVRKRICRACGRAGRSDAEAIELVAVTKGHPIEALSAAREAGVRVIGESRVQEARAKWELAGDLGLSWHLVGPLQRNKVRQALPLFTLIHSVDSLRLARQIDRQAARRGEPAAVLIQVNASGEPSKQGLAVGEALITVREICALENLRVLGLMTIAPYTDDESVLRETFRRTRALHECCGGEVPGFEARHLSMGMTNDFEIAVEEGSTMVRLGTVLFGERGR